MTENKQLFDCRRYILPGDRIYYDSMKCCNSFEDVDRRTPRPNEATVIRSYEKFVVVKLKRITEIVNRWDIRKINGRQVGNNIGYFGGLIARA